MVDAGENHHQTNEFKPCQHLTGRVVIHVEVRTIAPFCATGISKYITFILVNIINVQQFSCTANDSTRN